MGNRYLVIIQLFILVLLYQGSVSSNQQTFQLHLQQLLNSSSSDCCLHSRQKDCLEKLLRPPKEACKAPSSVTHTSSERKHKPTHNQQFPHRYSFLCLFNGQFEVALTIYSCHTTQTAHRFSHQNQMLLNLFSVLKEMWLSVLYLQHGETNTEFCSRTEQEQYFIFKTSFSLDERALRLLHWLLLKYTSWAPYST